MGNIHKGRNLSMPRNYHCTEPYLCSCVINPLPTSAVKECLNELSPAISSSVNLSLEQGHFPDAWKGALVKSRLKKSGLELDEKKYRPVSNLVLWHAGFSLRYNRLIGSTETASLRVQNDILLKMNRQHVSLLVFLDLGSAFDMIDHTVLLRRLEDKFVFCRTALEFVPVGQIPTVAIDGATSDKFDIDFGLPQGSCIGLSLFSIYASQLFDIVTQHLPTVHCYADDTKLYLAFRQGDRATQYSAVAAVEACIQDVREWVIKDKLKIKDDKSEFILIGTQAQLKKMDIDNLAVGDSCISPSTDAIRNLGAWFDANFTMSTHVTKTWKTGFFYLHNISRIRKFLAQGITENLIHGFDEPPQLL